MIDRSESHLIARELRNRSDSVIQGGDRATRVARRFSAHGGAHEPKRGPRIEPVVSDSGNLDTPQPR